MTTNEEIRSYVNKLMSSKAMKGFYSSLIPKHTTANINEVEKELNLMVEEGLLSKEYELICHNDNCLRVLDRQPNKESFKSYYDCSYCGEEIEEVDSNFINERFVRNNK